MESNISSVYALEIPQRYYKLNKINCGHRCLNQFVMLYEK